MRKVFGLLCAAGVLTAACGKRVPEPINVVPGTPHISWVFMTGDRDTPDRLRVQSDPRSESVFSVGTRDEPTFADLHFYYHGAGAETRYTGAIQLGLFEGAANVHRMSVNINVKKDETIVNQSVIDRVATKPGVYVVALDLVATTSDGSTRPIRQEVSLTVK